tara:strand:- start:546 stop:932 length:387 start_codon:yes stop_codon:yes gene_type:complete
MKALMINLQQLLNNGACSSAYFYFDNHKNRSLTVLFDLLIKKEEYNDLAWGIAYTMTTDQKWRWLKVMRHKYKSIYDLTENCIVAVEQQRVSRYQNAAPHVQVRRLKKGRDILLSDWEAQQNNRRIAA